MVWIILMQNFMLRIILWNYSGLATALLHLLSVVIFSSSSASVFLIFILQVGVGFLHVFPLHIHQNLNFNLKSLIRSESE